MIKKWKQKLQRFAKQEDGFSLLEILLSVGAFGLIALGFVEMTQDYIEERQALSAANHMQEIHEAAYEYVLDNFDAIHTPLGVGNAVVLDIDNDQESVDELIAGGYLPQTYSSLNSYSRDVIVLFRNAGNENLGAVPPLSDRLEIILITAGDALDEQRVIKSAQELGGYAGLWSAIDRDAGAGTTVNSLIGTFGIWQVPAGPIQAALNAGGFTNNGGANFSAPAIGQAHLVTYRHINQNDSLGDYLYRVPVAGAPEANRMMVDIDMNNFNVDGVDNANINGDLLVRNVASFQGVVGARGTTNVAGSLLSDGNASANATAPQGAAVYSTDIANNANAQNVDMAAATGETVVNTATINTGTLDATELSGETVNVDTMTSATNSSFLATNIDVSNLIVSGNGANGRLETNTLDGGGGTNVQVNQSVEVQSLNTPSGSLDIPNNGLRVEGDLSIGTMQFGNRFTCNEGC